MDRTPKTRIATATAIVTGALLLAAAALASANSITVSAPRSVNYGQSVSFTVSGHGTKVRGARKGYPPNLVSVLATTTPSARCPKQLGGRGLRSVGSFHSSKVSQVLSHFSRKMSLKEDGHEYGLCTYLANFPTGYTYAHASAYWTVQGHAPTPPTLTVSLASPGQGRVLGYRDDGSNDGRIDCDPTEGGHTCSASYPPGTVVDLIANAFAGYTWVGWSGACSGTDPTCQVTVSSDETVTANFAPGTGS